MGFLLSWLLTSVFILLGSVALYPFIRITLKATRGLREKRWRRSARERAHTAWSQVSSHLHLDLQASSTPHRLQLTGQLPHAASQKFLIESFEHKNNDYTRIAFETDLPPDLELFFIGAEKGFRSIDGLTRRNPSYMPQQLQKFSRNFMVLGDQALAMALLNVGMRDVVEKLIEGTGLIHLLKSDLIFEREGLFESDEVLKQTIHWLQELAGMFTIRGHSIPAAILYNFRHDADGSVRLNNLKMLLSNFADTSEATTAEAEMHADSSPEVRFWAAKKAGEDGIPTIQEIAEDEETSEELRIAAYKYLASQIKEQESHYAVKVMMMMLDSPTLNSVAVIPIADAIERFGTTLDEDTCLKLLAWEEHPRVNHAIHIAACKHLLRCGTVKAMGPLMQREQARNKELRAAVEKAILHIKTRLGHDSAGGLSLYEEVAIEGALSGTEDIGALSLVEQIIVLNDEPSLQDDL